MKPESRGPRRPGRVLLRLLLVAALVYAAAGYLTSRLGPDPVTGWMVDVEVGSATDGGADAALRGAAGPDRSRPPVVLRGVLSVHSGRSHDAVGTLEEVVRAAQGTGLDFVVLGDHPGEWRLDGPRVLRPRLREGVLVLQGLELVVADVGRVLAVGLDTVPRIWEGDLQSLVARAEAADGFISVVHPRSPKTRESWKSDRAPGAHAWESFDVSEMARARQKEPWVLYHLVSLLAGLATGGGEGAVVQLWREESWTPAILAFDSIRAQGHVALTGGLNHHPKARLGPVLFPRYEPAFRAVVNHLVLEAPLPAEPEAAQTELLRVLRSGRLFVTLGDGERATGFGFAGWGPGGPVPMGGRAVWQEGSGLSVELPPDAGGRLLVRVLRDGDDVGWIEGRPGQRLSWAPDAPGVYRVEVFRAGFALGGLRFGLHPWILSNPVEFYAGGPTPATPAT